MTNEEWMKQEEQTYLHNADMSINQILTEADREEEAINKIDEILKSNNTNLYKLGRIESVLSSFEATSKRKEFR